jgi:chromosome segregation ATPase
MIDDMGYRLEMERKLNDLQRKIDELKTKVDVLEAQKSREFYERLEEFNAQHEELKSKVQDLHQLESGAQAEQKKYLEETFQNLKKDMEIRLAPYVEEQ